MAAEDQGTKEAIKEVFALLGEGIKDSFSSLDLTTRERLIFVLGTVVGVTTGVVAMKCATLKEPELTEVTERIIAAFKKESEGSSPAGP